MRKTASNVPEKGSFEVKVGLAEMLKGGVIMDVTTPDQAKIAEDAGACAVMALERIPADIRQDGGVARMSSPELIQKIQEAVSIPVMAKCRIGHFVEAQILEALFVDFIDESEVLTPADEDNHIDKHSFRIPFVCGCRNLGEALRRIGEGAAMIRTKGEAGTGNIVEAVRHMRTIKREIRQLSILDRSEWMAEAKRMGAPYQLVEQVALLGKLPVPNFAAGGIATPSDAALMMQLGAESVFVGSGIFKSEDPEKRAKAIVMATTYYNDPEELTRVSMGLLGPMKGLEMQQIKKKSFFLKEGGSLLRCIGVLALQGAFAKHREMLDLIEVPSIEVKRAKDLEQCDGLILPGGESPTFFRQLDWSCLTEPLKAFAKEKPLFGTCAGLILMAKAIAWQDAPIPFGFLDVTVERNAWGRQVESFKAKVDLNLSTQKMPMDAIFIRAPRIVAVGKGVRVLATYQGEPILVQQGRHLGATFHPELAKDPTLHKYFVTHLMQREGRVFNCS